MADYWKSQARKFCDTCSCWIADNKPSIDFHEGGRKHKENLNKRLKEIHKNSAKQAKQIKSFQNDIDKMEKAAMAAYLKDVQSNTRDLSADKMIQKKWSKTKDNNYEVADIDPLDPFAQRKLASLASNKAKRDKEAVKLKAIKENEKKVQNVPKSNTITKVWYEAQTQGQSYFWNVKTNESVWELPVEGYVSIAEQAEQAKEQEIQEKFLKVIEEEESKLKQGILEEQKASAAREKLKEVRKLYLEKNLKETNAKSEDIGSIEIQIPYRRDYSIPEKQQPYGSWKTVKNKNVSGVDLELPQVTEVHVSTDTKKKSLQRQDFKEKTITHVFTGDYDDDGTTISFKKRKFGQKNVRKRLED